MMEDYYGAQFRSPISRKIENTKPVKGKIQQIKTYLNINNSYHKKLNPIH